MRSFFVVACFYLLVTLAPVNAYEGSRQDGWHHPNERVHAHHPWYHHDHVYYHNGNAYPHYYYGHPYYYYDPNYYYWDQASTGVNIKVALP